MSKLKWQIKSKWLNDKWGRFGNGDWTTEVTERGKDKGCKFVETLHICFYFLVFFPVFLVRACVQYSWQSWNTKMYDFSTILSRNRYCVSELQGQLDWLVKLLFFDFFNVKFLAWIFFYHFNVFQYVWIIWNIICLLQHFQRFFWITKFIEHNT